MDRKKAETSLKNDWYINNGNLIVEHDKVNRFLEACGMGIKALHEPERKKGKWLSELKEDGDSLLRCSICNYPVSYFWSRTNFCPECGADLRGKNNGKIKTEND